MSNVRLPLNSSSISLSLNIYTHARARTSSSRAQKEREKSAACARARKRSKESKFPRSALHRTGCSSITSNQSMSGGGRKRGGARSIYLRPPAMARARATERHSIFIAGMRLRTRLVFLITECTGVVRKGSIDTEREDHWTFVDACTFRSTIRARALYSPERRTDACRDFFPAALRCFERNIKRLFARESALPTRTRQDYLFRARISPGPRLPPFLAALRVESLASWLESRVECLFALTL